MKQLRITKQKQQDKRYSGVPITDLRSCVKTMLSTFVCCLFVCVIVLWVTAPLQMRNTNQEQIKECYSYEETQETKLMKTSEPQATQDCSTVTTKQDKPKKKPVIVMKDKKQVMYTTVSLNLREEPDANSNKIKVLPTYEKITVYSTNFSSWYFTSYKGKSGYVCKKYLSKYQESKYIDIGLEYQYQDLVRELIKKFNFDVDEYFFYGMMYTENRFRQEPESSAGAQGILQILPSTWNSLLPLIKKQFPELYKSISRNPFDKKSNIVVGMYYIKYIRDSYGYKSLANNASKVLTTYNRGAYNAKLYYKKHKTYSTAYSQEILRAAKYIRVHKTWKEGL